MSITVVQAVSAQVVNGATDNSVTVTLPSPTRSGNLLVACVSDNYNFGDEVATPVTDNASNTWNVAVPIFSPAARYSQRYAMNIAGRSGHTVTYTVPGTTFFPSIAVAELAGAITSAALDQVARYKGEVGYPTPRTLGLTGNTEAADEIAISGLTHGGGSNEVITSASGFTIQTKQEATAKMPITLATLLINNFGTASDSVNFSPNTNTWWAGGIATYIAAPTATVTYGFTSS